MASWLLAGEEVPGSETKDSGSHSTARNMSTVCAKSPCLPDSTGVTLKGPGRPCPHRACVMAEEPTLRKSECLIRGCNHIIPLWQRKAPSLTSRLGKVVPMLTVQTEKWENYAWLLNKLRGKEVRVLFPLLLSCFRTRKQREHFK